MECRVLVSLTVSLMLMAPAPATAPTPPHAGTAPAIEWTSFGQGLEAAKRHKKPVLVQFFATWCGYCRRMDATTFTNAAVATDLKKAVTVKVDGEEEAVRDGYKGADLANKYGVRLFPTHVLLDGDGKVVSRAPGFMEPQQFLSWFKLSLAKAYQQQSAAQLPASGS
jgi:thioredoxin-related protein